MIILTSETYMLLVIKNDCESELTWMSILNEENLRENFSDTAILDSWA